MASFIMMQRVGLAGLYLICLMILSSCSPKIHPAGLDPFHKTLDSKDVQIKGKPNQLRISALKPPPFDPLPPEVRTTVSFDFMMGKDILQDLDILCRKVGLDLEVSQGLPCFVWQRASRGRRALIHVIEEVCHANGWRYRVVGPTLYLEADTPYFHMHPIPFPLGGRQSRSQLQLGTDLGGTFSGHGGAGAQGQSTLSSKTDVDFWGELEKTLILILQDTPASHNTRALVQRPPHDGQEKSKIQTPPVSKREVQPVPSSSKRTFKRVGSRSSRLLWVAPRSGDQEHTQDPDRESLVASNSTSNSTSTSPSPSTSPVASSFAPSRPIPSHEAISPSNSLPSTHPISHKSGHRSPSYALHKQAGVVSVYGSKRQHRLIHDYLHTIKQLTHLQVTVEAQIVEIFLKKKYQRGVDWQVLSRLLEGGVGAGIPQAPGVFSLRFKTPSVRLVLGALEEFGRIRTLSNPRVTVLNNQPALIKVVKGEVFFRLEVDRILSSTAKPDLETTTSQMQTIPIGLIMVVQPSVDYATGEVVLSLRPTLSRVVEFRNDPAVSLRSENKVQSQIPVVQTRELDSVIRIRPHETVLMGGLMETSHEEETSGLEVLKHIPLVGSMFGGGTQTDSSCELVIVLRVWVDGASSRPDPEA